MFLESGASQVSVSVGESEPFQGSMIVEREGQIHWGGGGAVGGLEPFVGVPEAGVGGMGREFSLGEGFVRGQRGCSLWCVKYGVMVPWAGEVMPVPVLLCGRLFVR